MNKKRQPVQIEQEEENDDNDELIVEGEGEGEEEQNFPTNIKPIRLLVKFEPPLIGLLYNDLDMNKKHIYNILLNGLINLEDPEEITKHIFNEHNMFFNERFVNFNQVEKLVVKILEYYIHLANLDEDQLAQYYAQGKNDEYMGDEDDYEHENNSPAQQKVDNSKNKRGKTYQMEDLDVQEYERAPPPPKKKNMPKHEALSD